MSIKSILIIFLIVMNGRVSSNQTVSNNSLLLLNSGCTRINVIFFDLGDTLIENAGNGMFQLRSGASEMIQALTLEGIKLGVITNVPSNWVLNDLENILIDPTFLDDFEVVVLSSQAPAAKPDPAIFTHAYSLLSNPPLIEQVAFVTESLGHIANSENNPTLGARAVGMIGIHLSDSSPSPLTNFTVASDDFQAIVDIVNNLIFCNDFETAQNISIESLYWLLVNSKG